MLVLTKGWRLVQAVDWQKNEGQDVYHHHGYIFLLKSGILAFKIQQFPFYLLDIILFTTNLKEPPKLYERSLFSLNNEMMMSCSYKYSNSGVYPHCTANYSCYFLTCLVFQTP